jgi:hypothetical protein
VLPRAWDTAAAALTACARALGDIRDVRQIAAASGLAFRISVDAEVSLAGPHAYPFAEVLPAAAARLGYACDFVSCSERPDGALAADARRRALALIDQSAGRSPGPTLIWGVHAPEFGLCLGRDGERLRVSGILDGAAPDTLPASALGRGDVAIVFALRLTAAAPTDDDAGLRAALLFGRGPAPALSGFHSGAAAWRAVEAAPVPDADPSFVTQQIASGAFLLLFALAVLLNGLIFSPADLGAKGSVFPSHMLVLPLRTRALVGWPMLYGAVLNCILWMLLASLVLIPAKIPLPLLLPAAILMAVTAWIQAISWSPFPSPFVRIPVLLLAIFPTAALGSWRAFDPSSPHVYWLATAGSLAWMLAAYGFGVTGLSRARKGNAWYWSGWHALSLRRAWLSGNLKSRPAFRSPAAAALWFECRRGILFLPVTFAMVVIPLLVEVSLQALGLERSEGLMLGPLGVVPPAALLIGALVFTAFVFSALAGANMAKPDLWSKEELTTFFAARPATTGQIVARKMKAAAVSAAIGWAMVVSVIAVWIILESSSLNPHKSQVYQWLREASQEEIALALVAAIALWPLMWRAMTVAMFPSMIGRKWISTALGFALGLAVFAMPGLVGWVFKDLERRERFVTYLPWMLAAFVVLKLTTAAVIGLSLDRLGLLTRRDLARAAALWLSVTALVFATISFFTAWSWYTAAAAILIVPMARIGAAPLALHWNRCR